MNMEEERGLLPGLLLRRPRPPRRLAVSSSLPPTPLDVSIAASSSSDESSSSAELSDPCASMLEVITTGAREFPPSYASRSSASSDLSDASDADAILDRIASRLLSVRPLRRCFCHWRLMVVPPVRGAEAETISRGDAMLALIAGRLLALRPLRRAVDAWRFSVLSVRHRARLSSLVEAMRLSDSLYRWRTRTSEAMLATTYLYKGHIAGRVASRLRALRRWATLPRSAALLRIAGYVNALRSSTGAWRQWVGVADCAHTISSLWDASSAARAKLARVRACDLWREYVRRHPVLPAPPPRRAHHLSHAVSRWRSYVMARRLRLPPTSATAVAAHAVAAPPDSPPVAPLPADVELAPLAPRCECAPIRRAAAVAVPAAAQLCVPALAASSSTPNVPLQPPCASQPPTLLHCVPFCAPADTRAVAASETHWRCCCAIDAPPAAGSNHPVVDTAAFVIRRRPASTGRLRASSASPRLQTDSPPSFHREPSSFIACSAAADLGRCFESMDDSNALLVDDAGVASDEGELGEIEGYSDAEDAFEDLDEEAQLDFLAHVFRRQFALVAAYTLWRMRGMCARGGDGACATVLLASADIVSPATHEATALHVFGSVPTLAVPSAVGATAAACPCPGATAATVSAASTAEAATGLPCDLAASDYLAASDCALASLPAAAAPASCLVDPLPLTLLPMSAAPPRSCISPSALPAASLPSTTLAESMTPTLEPSPLPHELAVAPARPTPAAHAAGEAALRRWTTTSHQSPSAAAGATAFTSASPTSAAAAPAGDAGGSSSTGEGSATAVGGAGGASKLPWGSAASEQPSAAPPVSAPLSPPPPPPRRLSSSAVCTRAIGAAAGACEDLGLGADDLTSPNAASDDAPTRPSWQPPSIQLGGSATSVCDAGQILGALSGLDSGGSTTYRLYDSGSTTPIATRRSSSWPCALLDDIDQPSRLVPLAHSPCRQPDRVTLDPDPPRIREAGTAAEGALVTTLVDTEGSDAGSSRVATPARGVAIAALTAASVGTQEIARLALERPGLKRLELTERPDGSLVLNAAFDEAEDAPPPQVTPQGSAICRDM